MSSTEVNKLRREGKLQEALELAEKNLSANATSIWNRRAGAWVYYDYLKETVELSQFTEFIEILRKISILEIPKEEKRFYNALIKPISKILHTHINCKQWDEQKSNQLFEILQKLPFSPTTENFSVLIKALHRAFQGSKNYIDVIDWCGFDSFNTKDYLPITYDGKEFMSLVEQVYFGYAKHLIEGTQEERYSTKKSYDKERMQAFLPKLESVIKQLPKRKYLFYFKIKIQLILGCEDIMKSFLPFAQQNRKEFWVWQLLAEINSTNPELVFSSYCKALSLRAKEEYLVRVRLELIPLLLERQLLIEARTEIETIIRVCDFNNRKLPIEINRWINQAWYDTVRGNSSNRFLYQKNEFLAEEMLFSSVPEEIVALEYINEEKKIANFIKNKSKRGCFRYNKLLNNPKIGEVYAIRFENGKIVGQYNVLTIKRVARKHSEVIKRGENTIRIGQLGFGFVDDIFVSKQLIEQANVVDRDAVKYKAILNFNRKLNEWGWRVFWLEKV